MALEQTISPDDHWFLGEDKELVFTIYTDDTKTACLDVTGYALQWTLCKREGAAALITKATGGNGITIAGVYNADPALNLQRVTVTILKTDTDPFLPGAYRQRLRRTDTGFATVFTFGDVALGHAA